MRDRNVSETIAECKIPSVRELTACELKQIYDLAEEKGSKLDMITIAFNFGYAVGHRGGLADAKRK